MNATDHYSRHSSIFKSKILINIYAIFFALILFQVFFLYFIRLIPNSSQSWIYNKSYFECVKRKLSFRSVKFDILYVLISYSIVNTQKCPSDKVFKVKGIPLLLARKFFFFW